MSVGKLNDSASHLLPIRMPGCRAPKVPYARGSQRWRTGMCHCQRQTLLQAYVQRGTVQLYDFHVELNLRFIWLFKSLASSMALRHSKPSVSFQKYIGINLTRTHSVRCKANWSYTKCIACDLPQLIQYCSALNIFCFCVSFHRDMILPSWGKVVCMRNAVRTEDTDGLLST